MEDKVVLEFDGHLRYHARQQRQYQSVQGKL